MKLRRLLAAFLCGAVMTSAFASCGGGTSDSTGESVGGYTDSVFADTSIVLAENGGSDYVVVTPADNQSEAMKYAVKELKYYIQSSTGAELKTATDAEIGSADASGKYISLGETSLLKNSGLIVDENELGHDGYLIKRVKNSVFIAGAYDSGTTFGVWEFLHYEIGYEFFADKCETYDKVETLKLKDFDYVDTPDFYQRNMDGYMQYKTVAAYKLRINGPKICNSAVYMDGNNPYVASSSGHGLQYLLPPSKYYAQHPEWYLAYDRNNEFYNACLTADGVVDAVVESIKEYAEKNPDAYMVDLCQGDGSGIWCSCENCQSEITKYKHSGYYIRFCNKVIAAVDEWRERENIERDFEYLMFTYQETNIPPVNADGTLIDPSCKANDKLYLYRTGGAFCYSHSMDDPDCSMNSTKIKEIEQWSAVTDKSIIWDYGVNYGYYLFFFNDYSTIKSHAQFYKSTGAKFYSKELNSGAEVMSFAALRSYLYAKFMWNTEYDTEELISAFMSNYYGDCSEYMSDALNGLRTAWEVEDIASGHTKHQRVPASYEQENLSKSALDRAYSLMTVALETCDEKIANGTTEEANEYSLIRKRVLTERVCIATQILYNYSAYGYDLNNMSEFVSQLKSEAKECEVVMFSQQQKFDDFIAQYEN